MGSGKSMKEMKNCGYWPVRFAKDKFGSDWNKRSGLVDMAKKQKCKDKEEVASTIYHLVMLYHNFPEDMSVFRVPTKEAIEYMQNNGCRNIHMMVSKGIKDYKSWKGYAWKKDVKVKTLDIITRSYQTVTNAQNVKTHTWSRSFLTNILGITARDMKKVDSWCMKRKSNVRASCKADVPTFMVIYFLHNQFPDYIEDWRLSARLALSGMKYKGNSLNLANQVYKVMGDPNMKAVEILMTNT